MNIHGYKTLFGLVALSLLPVSARCADHQWDGLSHSAATNMYVSSVQLGINGDVTFKVRNPPVDVCYENVDFLFNIYGENALVSSVTGRQFLAILMMSKLNRAPLDIWYYTSASFERPINSEPCNQGNPEDNLDISRVMHVGLAP